jgi:phosphatidylglycerol:prolipoprotein diacylglycerol transferase
LEHPVEIFMPWQGGMSAHGAIIGLFVCGYVVARRHGLPMLAVTDSFAAPLVLGQALGRLGNFANGELWGAPTSLPWGIVFPSAGDGAPRHPAQLYESALDFALWGILFRLRDSPFGLGMQTGIWTLGYGLARLGVEFFRDTPSTVGPFSTAQLLSLPMPVIGLWLIARARAAGALRVTATPR